MVTRREMARRGVGESEREKARRTEDRSRAGSACARTVHGGREPRVAVVAESWWAGGSVRISYTCSRRQRSLGRFPRVRVHVAPNRVREDTARLELGFRQERTATNQQDEAQNATGESCPPVVRRFLSPFLSRSVSLARERLSSWLSSPRLGRVKAFRSVIPLSLEESVPPRLGRRHEERSWLRNGARARMRLTVLATPESSSSKKSLCILPEVINHERKGNHAALTPLEDMSAGRGQAGGGPPQHCQKVFIQRDYSEGTMVKFQTRFPTELENRLDRQLFEYTINQLNNYFVEAERASCSTYCESCLYCLTGYLISICTETHYEKCLRKVAKFVSEQNDRVYKPRGLLLTDPTTRGLRLIEISVLDRPAS